MTDPSLRYADWKAPKEDGALLLWPDARALLSAARGNHAKLSVSEARVQNAPLSALRADFRRFAGVADDGQLAFVAGHQAELHHPGVWVKNVVLDAAAGATGGVAIHVAVDTDAPKHLTLRFPGFSEPFTDDLVSTSADWAGLVAPPTPAHLASLAAGVRSAGRDWPFMPAIGGFFDAARRQLLESQNLPEMLAATLHAFDWDLGLRHGTLLASPLWTSRPFLSLAHHLLANADGFAADYNAALQAYRVRHHLHAVGRPMPDLAVHADRCETPFWRDDLAAGRRTRTWLDRDGAGWALSAGDDRLSLDRAASADVAADRLLAFCRRHHLRLAPRALTLTLSLRLLLADQFVHGIGGGQYDQVTDDLLWRHFGIEPPAFSVSTATLYWPTAAGRSRPDLPALLREGRRLKYAALGRRQRDLAARIAAAPRHSAERFDLFQLLHSELDKAVASSPAISEWRVRFARATEDAIASRAIFDRELFYALQPAERLAGLIEAVRSQFA